MFEWTTQDIEKTALMVFAINMQRQRKIQNITLEELSIKTRTNMIAFTIHYFILFNII